MTEATRYICDICGEAFDDEANCRYHEMNHSLIPIGNHLRLYNKRGEELFVDAEATSLDEVYVVVWDALEAISAFCDWMEQAYGYVEDDLSYFKSSPYGKIYWKNDQWNDFARLKALYTELDSYK